MNWGSAVFWGFCATVILTTFLSAGRGLGLTRMDIPFMLGAMLTANRTKAKVLGFIIHLLNGWVFALIYIFAFVKSGITNWWFGAVIGLVHSLFVLTMGMNVLPYLHPRMADEQFGPDPTRQLQPPGFLARNYGNRTPIATVLAHIIFGAVLGLFYRS